MSRNFVIRPSITGPNIGRPTKYPFWDMDVGDILLVPADKVDAASVTARVFAHRNKRKFTLKRNGQGATIERIK